MGVEGIRDGESLKAWLEALPQGTEEEQAEARRRAVAIAHRASMRVLPRYCLKRYTYGHEKLMINTNIMLPNLIVSVSVGNDSRAMRTAAEAVALQSIGPDLSDSAGAAALVTDFASTAARAVAGSADFAARGVSAEAATLMWDAVRVDCGALISGASLDQLPLWTAANPLGAIWAEVRPQILAEGPDWHFWINWYENALHGRHQDWDLLSEIALIAPADWDKGADHVNGLIQQIIRDHRPAPNPEQPKLTDVERSHIALVIAAPYPARQSAEFLCKRFEEMECAYRAAVGHPNETPPEIEPIVTLSRTFGQIAALLRDLDDREALIAELTTKIRTLEAANVQLAAAITGERGAFMRGVFLGVVGEAVGGAVVQAFGYVGGPFITEGIGPLWDLLKPPGPSEVPVVPEFPPTTSV